MLDKIVVEKKLRKIEQYLKELDSVNIKNFEEFQTQPIIKRFVERNIELSIEQMIDICRHIISALDLKEPETYSECFDILGSAKIIPDDKIKELFKSMVRFRNLLIHAYDEIDDSITYGILKKRLGDFNIFIKTIRNYLNK